MKISCPFHLIGTGVKLRLIDLLNGESEYPCEMMSHAGSRESPVTVDNGSRFRNCLEVSGFTPSRLHEPLPCGFSKKVDLVPTPTSSPGPPRKGGSSRLQMRLRRARTRQIQVSDSAEGLCGRRSQVPQSEKYDNFFADMRSLSGVTTLGPPREETPRRRLRPSRSWSAEVGSFVASFVPTIRTFPA